MVSVFITTSFVGWPMIHSLSSWIFNVQQERALQTRRQIRASLAAVVVAVGDAVARRLPALRCRSR